MANDRVSKALGERFSFTIANTSGALKVIAILAAFFDTFNLTLTEGAPNTWVKAETNPAAIVAAGFACDVVLDDGTIATNVVATASNSKMSIRQFREYIKNNPRVLIDMSVQANNVAAFNQTMEVIKCSPLQGSAPQYLPLTEFRSVDQTSQDKINVNQLGLEMAYDTLMLLPVENGHTVTVSFKFS